MIETGMLDLSSNKKRLLTPIIRNNITTTMRQYDRFNLEEEIQNVWQTKDDLNAIAERLHDDPDDPLWLMSQAEMGNLLTGLSELHETRMKKLWKVFETMVQQKNSFIMMTEEATLGDVLDKIVDDAEKEDEENESNTRI